MKQIKLLGEKDNPFKVKRVRKAIKRLMPVTIVIGFLIILSLFLITFSSSATVVNYIFSGNNLRSNGGRVNILLLGTAGGIHDGPNLTDTIMVASYDLKSNKLYLISIPRDLWLPSLKAKVNSVYQLGLNQSNGLNYTKTIISNILGLPIQYGLRLDFSGFEQAIDIIDGIDVKVLNTFDDYNYPIAGKENDLCGYSEKEIDVSSDDATKLNLPVGKNKVFVSSEGIIATDSAKEDIGAKYFTCRYEHIHFDEGMQHMDGTLALKFVRSRHGTSGEASDFARSKRQEEVIKALRSKLLSFETLINPQKISELIKTLGKSIDTDISLKDVVEFYKLSKKLDQTKSLVLDDLPKSGLVSGRTSLLIHPSSAYYGGAYVLISQDDDFSLIQDYIRKLITGGLDNEASASARPVN